MRHDLAGLGARTWLPDTDGAQACIDKAAFCAVLARNGLPVPRTWLPHEVSQMPDGVSLVVKPRYGQGSKNVYFCAERRQAAVLCELAPDPVIQEHVPGRELTADFLADRDGRASVILRWRLLVKGGLSVVSATFRDEEAAGLVRRVLAAIGAAGPCCVQGIIRDDGTRPRVQFIEANARFARRVPPVRGGRRRPRRPGAQRHVRHACRPRSSRYVVPPVRSPALRSGRSGSAAIGRPAASPALTAGTRGC
jgi:carbamoyl-phosphate synthase large subunit